MREALIRIPKWNHATLTNHEEACMTNRTLSARLGLSMLLAVATQVAYAQIGTGWKQIFPA
jgi:hypothetical protein